MKSLPTLLCFSKVPTTRNICGAALVLTPVLLGLSACKPKTESGSSAQAQAAATTMPPTSAATSREAAPSPANPADPLAQTFPQNAALNLAPPTAPATPLPDVVAVVEGQEIKKEELEQALNNELARQGIPADQIPEEQKSQGYKSLLNDLITERLISKRAASMEAKEEDVNSQFDQLKARFPNPETFDAQLAKSGQSPDKIREDIRSYLKQQAWVKDQIKDAPKATDADAEEFYTKNPDQFKKPEQVRASHILVSVGADASEETLKEKKKAADEIARRVKEGEAFDKLAAELSEDPSAKQNSGDLNFFTKEQMVPEFSDAAFSMKKGDISDPVKSQFGFHIIQVTDRKEAETMSLESVKPQLLAFINQRKQSSEVEKLIKEVREKAEVKINLP